MIYTLITSPENFRIILDVMKRKGDFDSYFDSYFKDELQFEVSKVENYTTYITNYFITPLQDGTTRLDIQSTKEGGFAGWNEIKKELRKNSITIEDTTNFETVVIHGHSYIDPSTISNPNHRKVVWALIEAELSPAKVTQKEVAEKVGYSQNQVSTISNLYKKERG